MIGKPEWFERRKYGGWGIHPKNWKGGVYIALVILPLIIFHSLPYWDNQTRAIVTGAWALFLLVDTVDIMIRMKRDEREKIHEALAERNAVWAMSLILTIGLAYQIIISAINKKIMVDWWIVGAITAGLIVKSISNYALERKH